MKQLEDFQNSIAGFELCGWRQVNGTIKLNTKKYIADWPEEIELYGTVYTKEDVIKGNLDERTGAQHENAIYA